MGGLAGASEETGNINDECTGDLKLNNGDLAGDRAMVEPIRSTNISIKDTRLKRAIEEASQYIATYETKIEIESDCFYKVE